MKHISSRSGTLLEQWFSNLLLLGTPSPAHFVCLPHITPDSIISSLMETARPEEGVSDIGRHTKCAVLGVLHGAVTFCMSPFFRHNSGAFQTGYIALRRALRSENNHVRHTEGSFQTEVLKTGHFKGPFGMKDFEGYN